MFVVCTGGKIGLSYLMENGKFQETHDYLKTVKRFKTEQEARNDLKKLRAKGNRNLLIGEICNYNGTVRLCSL